MSSVTKKFPSMKPATIVWRPFLSELNRLVARLDLEVDMAGIGWEIANWPFHGFNADPYWRLYLPVTGSFLLHFEDLSFMVATGNMILVPPAVPFSFEGNVPCTHFYLHFRSAGLQEHFRIRYPLQIAVDVDKFQAIFCWFITLDDSLGVETLAASATTENYSGFFRKGGERQTPDKMTLVDFVEVHNRLLRLLTPFLEKMLGEGVQSESVGRFAKVLTAIEDMLPGEVDLQKLARLAGMHRAEFSSSFRKAFGLGPREYSVNRRIDIAKRLLISSTLSIKEIAAKSGYDSIYYFHRVFRRVARMTPSEYRRRGIME